jgi:hypothetical protein
MSIPWDKIHYHANSNLDDDKQDSISIDVDKRHSSTIEELSSLVESLIENFKYACVLVVECQSGDIVRRLARLPIYRLIGIDSRASNIRTCHRLHPTPIKSESGSSTTSHPQGELEFLVDDVRFSMLHDNSVDVVIWLASTQSTRQTARLDFINRLLRKNAYCITMEKEKLNFIMTENNNNNSIDERGLSFKTIQINQHKLKFVEKNNRKVSIFKEKRKNNDDNNDDDDDDDDDDDEFAIDANFFDDDGDALAAATAHQVWESSWRLIDILRENSIMMKSCWQNKTIVELGCGKSARLQHMFVKQPNLIVRYGCVGHDGGMSRRQRRRHRFGRRIAGDVSPQRRAEHVARRRCMRRCGVWRCAV